MISSVILSLSLPINSSIIFNSDKAARIIFIIFIITIMNVTVVFIISIILISIILDFKLLRWFNGPILYVVTRNHTHRHMLTTPVLLSIPTPKQMHTHKHTHRHLTKQTDLHRLNKGQTSQAMQRSNRRVFAITAVKGPISRQPCWEISTMLWRLLITGVVKSVINRYYTLTRGALYCSLLHTRNTVPAFLICQAYHHR